MYKLTIEAEEPSKIQRVLAADELCGVIESMFEELRKVWKYSDNDVAVEHADFWRDKLNDILNYKGIDFQRINL